MIASSADASASYGAEQLGWNNKPVDGVTGWSDHGARWMATEMGRWLTPDPPVKGPSEHFMLNPWDAHPYQYARQNPLAYWDPDGRFVHALLPIFIKGIETVGKGVVPAGAGGLWKPPPCKLGCVDASPEPPEELYKRVVERGSKYRALKKIAGSAGKALARDLAEQLMSDVSSSTTAGDQTEQAQNSDTAASQSGKGASKGKGASDGAIRVTPEGIDRIERHLTQTPGIEAGPAEALMIQRLRDGHRTSQDLRFYEHEMIESDLMKEYAGKFEDPVDAARAAHHETLKKQDLYRRGYESELYVPEAQKLLE